jgi:prolyl-tRNA editing enzyme YbaK/EbsC (Cys-tRNA(Pro) deacylase)
MGQEKMSSADLKDYIDKNQIEATILPMGQHTPTVGDAARALKVTPEKVIKSLIFLINDEPHLVINNGLARVDNKKIARHLGVGRNKVKFASAAKALQITGFIVGSMPPFGHRRNLPTLVDPAVAALEEIYGGGGDIDAMLRMTAAELLRVTSAEVVAVSQ